MADNKKKKPRKKPDIDKEMKKVAGPDADLASIKKKGKEAREIHAKGQKFATGRGAAPYTPNQEKRSQAREIFDKASTAAQPKHQFTRPNRTKEGSAAPKDLPVGVRKFKNKGADNPEVQGSVYSGATGSLHRISYQDTYNQLKQEHPRATDAQLSRLTRNALNARRARQAGVAQDYLQERAQNPVVRVPSQQMGDLHKAEQTAGWKTEQGLFTNPDASKGKYTSTSAHIKTLPPAMQSQIDKDARTAGTPLTAGLDLGAKTHGGKYPKGVTRRIQIVSRSLQDGASLQEAYAKAAQDNRGRGTGGVSERRTGRADKRAQGRKDKYVSTKDHMGSGFQFGVSGSTIDKSSALRERFPDAADKDIVRMQQYQRMNVADEVMKNQRWAHETQRARILGKTPGREVSDRVVFFTTSVGHPAASVPSDSLIGQYVIKQRKKFLAQERVYKPSQMSGRFPETVRDMHVVELGTGISFGTQGVVGAFQKTGWRAGTKKSRGYGRPVPVGSQIMYDSSGRPVYDSQGNIRFTDGATRTYDIGTDKDLGLRVFIG